MDNLIIPGNKMLPKQSQSEDDESYVGSWIKVETSRATKRYQTAIVPKQTSAVAQNNVAWHDNGRTKSIVHRQQSDQHEGPIKKY